MTRTLVIRREYRMFFTRPSKIIPIPKLTYPNQVHYVPKYQRYEKRHKNLSAHVSPALRVEEGDWVTVGQCRPISKTVRPDFHIPGPMHYGYSGLDFASCEPPPTLYVSSHYV